MSGLDLLGAVSVATAKKEQSQSRAAASGQRALAAAQKIARVAPRLAAAVQKLGQKAIAASQAKAPAASAKTPPTATKAPAHSPAAPTTQPRPQVAAQRPQIAPPRGVVPSRASFRGPAHVGDIYSQLSKISTAADAAIKSGQADLPAGMTPDDYAAQTTQQTADTYSQLADAATDAANLLSELQGLVGKLPAGIPLAQQGQQQIGYLESWFVQPIEKALEGTQGAPAAQDLISALQGVMAMRDQQPPQGVWIWVSQANGYLKAHGIGGAVASIVISPQTPTVAPGATLQLTAAPTDATGKATTPGSPLQWSTSPGSTVDKSGNFTATAAGTYTVTASADGVTGSVRVTVAAGVPTSQATATGTITVQPQNPMVAPSTIQQFTATVNDSSGRPVSPAPPVTWSVTPSGPSSVIDPSGNFVAQAPGSYAITATAGGMTGTTTAQVSLSTAQMPAGGGYGSGGGGGYSGGGGGGYGGGSGGGGGGGADYGDDSGADDGAVMQPDIEPQPEYQADNGGDLTDDFDRDNTEMGLGMMAHAAPMTHWAPMQRVQTSAPTFFVDPAEDDYGDGLDMLGSAPDISAINRQTFAQRKLQIQELKTHPRAELRSWAKQQIDKVRSHYDGISWLSKHTPILSAKYDATLASLDIADGQFKNAEAEPDGQKANGLYVLALLSATDAAVSLADAESSSLSDDLVELVTTGAREETAWLASGGKALAKSVGEGAAQGLGVPTWAFWAGGAAALGALGYGAFRVAQSAAPVVVKRYLP